MTAIRFQADADLRQAIVTGYADRVWSIYCRANEFWCFNSFAESSY